jgi:hypothetical protein
MEEQITPVDTKKQIDVVKIALFFMLIILIAYTCTDFINKKQKFKEPKALINKVDSLEKENQLLKDSLVDLHSINSDYTWRIDSLNIQIDSLETATTGVKKDHHTAIGKVRKYNDNQVDSFFKARYKY